MGLGKINGYDVNEKFSMSILAANISQNVNGVSMLHGKVSQDIFANMYPGYLPEELHVSYVTNGVHYPTWAAKEWKALHAKVFGPEFQTHHYDKACFGGVYKLVAVEHDDGTIEPKIKISENVGKITNPHFKKLYRFYGNDTGKAIADYLCVHDETVDDTKDLLIFDPEATWKQKTVYNFTAKELQVPIFKNGELVYKLPTLTEIRDYCCAQVDTLWDEVKRFDNPHTYYVDLSKKLWDIKYNLLKNNASGAKHETAE